MTGTNKEYDDFKKSFNEKMYECRKKDYSDLVFLCIGTDRITGDSFGPLVGHKLNQLFKELRYCDSISVIGTLEEPLCGTNMKEKIKEVNSRCKNPYIIAIDSAVSKKEDIGKVIVSNKALDIGRAVDKQMRKIGHISIKGVVAKDMKIPKMNFTMLQNTSLNLVMNLADYTANGIYEAIKYG